MAERKWFKGKAALALDAWYSTGEIDETLHDAWALLRSDDSFEELVAQLDGEGRGNSEFVYPHSDVQGPEFERVARQGFLEAIALALEHAPPVPVRTFWMTGAGNDTYEMHVTDEAERVSVTVMVPDLEGGAHSPGNPEAWVVRIGGDGQVEVHQTSGPDQEQPSTRAS